MAGALFKSVKLEQPFKREDQTAFFVVFLLQIEASFSGVQCCYFDNLNIYS